MIDSSDVNKSNEFSPLGFFLFGHVCNYIVYATLTPKITRMLRAFYCCRKQEWLAIVRCTVKASRRSLIISIPAPARCERSYQVRVLIIMRSVTRAPRSAEASVTQVEIKLLCSTHCRMISTRAFPSSHNTLHLTHDGIMSCLNKSRWQ